MGRFKATADNIKLVNDKYYQLKTYSAVARELGIAPSTVKKYVIPNYLPEEEITILPLQEDTLQRVENYLLTKEELSDPNLLCYREGELEEIQEFWKEIVL